MINLLPTIMEQRGFNIYRLAKATHLPFHNVQRIVESPSIPPRTEYKTLKTLSGALGVKIDDLEKE